MAAGAVSKRSGLSPGTLRDILSGRSRNPGIVSLASIAAALDCELTDLLGEADHSRSPKSDRVRGNLADAIAAIVDPIGGIEIELPSRRSRRGFARLDNSES